MQIIHLKRNNIDVVAWDRCIGNATHTLPYAYSWYLDVVSPNWEALVLGNYDIVMPLTVAKKWFVKGLMQPYYCQQLGLFSEQVIDTDTAKAFLDMLRKKYWFAVLNFNPSLPKLEGYQGLQPRVNLVLDLFEQPYEIRKNYSENLQRNIRKAQKNGVEISYNLSIDAFKAFYLQNIKQGDEVFRPIHQQVFLRLTEAVMDNGMGQIVAARKSTGELISAILLLKHKGRAINLINTSNTFSKQTGAMHMLLDELICKILKDCVLFDFEGSTIPGVARFYQSFGARTETYFRYESKFIKQLRQR